MLALSSVQLITIPDFRLLVPCYRVKKFGKELLSLTDEMNKLMVKNNGIGLAATQVGYNISAFILSADLKMPVGLLSNAIVLNQLKQKSYYALVNPMIEEKSDELYDLINGEGCLSLPHAPTGRVNRHKQITLKYNNLQGETFTEVIKSLPATVIQHEFDHLIGILYTGRMNQLLVEDTLKIYSKKNKVPISNLTKFHDLMMKNIENPQFYLDYSVDQLKIFCDSIGMTSHQYELIKERIRVINEQDI